MSGGFVLGRKFILDSEYRDACEDAEKIEQLKKQTDMTNPDSVAKLYSTMQSGEIKFKTIIGRDFDDEIYELVQRFKREAQSNRDEVAPKKKGISIFSGKSKKNTAIQNRDRKNVKVQKPASDSRKSSYQKNDLNNRRTAKDIDLDKQAEELIAKANRRRRIVVILAALIAAGSLGYFIVYSKTAYSSQKSYDELASLKGSTPITEEIEQKPLFTLAEDEEMPEILDEYKNIYLKNMSIVGWLTIDGTNIDYPIMQTVNNDYYLKHDLNGKDDNNGALFMDYQCNVMFRSTNLIIYGHHMKSGKMFGNLKKYKSEDYCKEHNIIKFDTIFEKGTYEVMYVFQDEIKDAADVSFKYYQFIDANSEEEFDSNMKAMEEMSFFDTGVKASYGDELLTLSTCDGSTQTARFVVVAKRIK